MRVHATACVARRHLGARIAGATIAAGAVALGAGVAAAGAATIPTVVVAVAKPGHATLTGAGALKQGPTRFRFTDSSGKQETDISVFELKPGATAAQVVAAAAKLKGPPTPLQGATTGKALPSYTAELALAKATYLVIDSTAAPKLLASFTVGAGTSGASEPAPGATIRLRDFAIEAPATLPATGTIRFANSGPSPHFVAFARAKSPAAAKQAAMLLKQGKDAKAEKLITDDRSLLGLISTGVSNDVAVSSLKPGTYVLACFYGDAMSNMKTHTMLGMETVVTVK
jgi:hypothetical protein